MANKIKIGIGLRGLTKGGATRFILTWLAQFKEFSEKYEFYIFCDNKDLLEHSFDYAKKIFIKGKNKLLWDYIKFPLEARKYKLNCIIYPKGTIALSNIILKTKKINIIYDLAYFDRSINAYRFWDTIYTKLFMKLSCAISDKIIAISENTRRDIIDILKVNAGKVLVAHGSATNEFRKINDKYLLEGIIKKYKLKMPLLFYCGSLSPRKNILRVLKAFNGIKHRIPHFLYLGGEKAWKYKQILKYIEGNLSTRVFRLGHLEGKSLVSLYSLADLFLYPSLYEGFGLPIVEAQSCRCPVLTSSTTACLEVAGEGAHIVNPYSVEEIKNGILKILTGKEYKDNLIKKGIENVKRFSWECSAKIILNAVKDLR